MHDVTGKGEMGWVHVIQSPSVEIQLGDYHVEGPRFLGCLDDGLGVVEGEADELLCS